MLSFWEKQSFISYDYIIAGSGIVGLSTAASILEKAPKASVLILERGIFPTGASTKNAGFACFGSLTELLADLEKMPDKDVIALVNERWQGLLALRRRLGDTNIGFEGFGGYELITENELPCLDRISEINKLLQPVFGQPVYKLVNEHIDRFGFNREQVKALVANPLEGQIHTGQMMQSLLRYVQQLGATILTGCMVEGFEDKGSRVEVFVKGQVQTELIAFEANKLIICTNAFTRKLVPQVLLEPGRGQVLITSPLPQLPFRGAFHFDQGFYYFRDCGNRVLLGGGRNLDFEGEKTTELGLTPNIMAKLEQMLREVILPGQDFSIEQRWAGIMAFGDTKKPVLEHYSDNVILGVRMGGMGVAIGTRVGQQISNMLEPA